MERFFPCGIFGKTRQTRFCGIHCLTVVLTLCSGIPVMSQETIDYYGQSGAGNVLQTINGVEDSLGPTQSGNHSLSLSGNTISVSPGYNVPGNVYGASLESTTVDPNGVANNKVVLYGTAGPGPLGSRGYVYGGYASLGATEVKNNRVEILGGHVSQIAYGGSSTHGGASGNSVLVSQGGTVRLSAYGGFCNAAGNTSGNSVTLDGGAQVGQHVAGGRNGNASGTGSAISNSVVVMDATVGYGVVGGHCEGRGNALSNTVTIRGGTMGNGTGAPRKDVIGGWSRFGNAANNSVTVTGGTILQNVLGGSSDHAAASGNSVTLGGGTVRLGVYGGYGNGNGTVNGDVTGNRVTVDGTTTLVQGPVYGGRANAGHAACNSITLNGGTVRGNIVGGYSVSGDATGNTVTLSDDGSLNLAQSYLLGGLTSASGTGDVFSGNAFHLRAMNVTAAGLAHFENLNFYLPAHVKNGDTMLFVKHATIAALRDGVYHATEDEWEDYEVLTKTITAGVAEIQDSKVTVALSGAGLPLKPGEKIILIDADTLTGELCGSTVMSRMKKGVSLIYDILIVADYEWDELYLTVLGGGPEVEPPMEDLSKGFLTGMSLLNQGGDLVARHGMSGAVRAARESRRRAYGVFFDMAGGWSRYDTGCHVDLSSLSLITGLSKSLPLRGGNLMLGAFFEHGSGSYDTYNAFPDIGPTHGNGTLRHFGGGVSGRRDFGKFRIGHGDAGTYLEGGFRAGGLSNAYHNADIRDGEDRAARYDSASAYYATHVGIGGIRRFANGSSLDLSTKYLWTQMQGDTVTLSTEEPVDFETIHSHRLRLGGRCHFDLSRRVTPYLGGYWEREFDGTARASTHGFAIGTPSLRGDTGIGEAGIAIKPAGSRGFFIDLGVQCHGGKRDGAAATLHAGRKY